MDLRTAVVNQSKIKTSSSVTFEKGEEALWFAVPPPEQTIVEEQWKDGVMIPVGRGFLCHWPHSQAKHFTLVHFFPSEWHLCSFSKWNTRVVPLFSRLPQPRLRRTGIIWRGPLGTQEVKRFELDLQGSVAFSSIVQSASSCLCICFGAL